MERRRCFWQPYNWQMPGGYIHCLAAGTYGNPSSPSSEASGEHTTDCLHAYALIWGALQWWSVNLGAPSFLQLSALPAWGVGWCCRCRADSRLVTELVFAKVSLASLLFVKKALPVPLGNVLYQWHHVMQINAKCSLSPFQCNNSLCLRHLQGWMAVQFACY